ncbi:MAG TPA: hypothetical protein VGM37_05285 [Armatimonadota bacterium]|jgi:hypothetical protein
MTDDTLNGLNPFAQRFLETLLGDFPDWARYATIGSIYPRVNPAEAGTLLMKIPRPGHSDDEEGLVLSTLGDDENVEITVEFGGTHNHIDEWWRPDGCEEPVSDFVIAEAIKLVRDIVEERIRVVSDWRNGVPIDGAFTEPAPLGQPQTGCSGILWRSRSWLGTYDAEVDRRDEAA